MYTQDLKKCFQRELEINHELCELVKELLKELFPNDPMTVHTFESEIGYWDENRCFQGVDLYKRQFQERKEWKEKNATKTH